MRFSFDANPTGGLRVIREFPDEGLIQLEGRNGIGKTLAVRLLEMCTGNQPYLDRAASWVTLKAHLGRVVISVDKLKNGDALQFELIPEQWPDSPQVIGEWLGTATLNGKVVSWSGIPNLLRVSRIGGDETLGETLAAEVARDAERLRQFQERHRNRTTIWSQLLRAVSRLGETAATADLRRLSSTRAFAEKAYALASDELAVMERAAEAATEVSRLLERADRIEARQPRLETQSLELADREGRVRAAVEELDRSSANLIARSHMSITLQAQVSDLAHLQRLRQERRERRRHEVEQIRRAAGVNVPVDLQGVDKFTSDLRQELEGLRLRRLSQDRSGLLLELISNVGRPVGHAAKSGLAAEVIAQLPAGPVSVDGLGQGLGRRRKALLGQTSDEASKLQLEIRQLEARLQALADLPRVIRLRQKADEDLSETVNQLTNVLKQLNRGDAASYQEVNAKRSALLDELIRVSQDRSDCERELTDLLNEGSASELRAAALALSRAQGRALPHQADEASELARTTVDAASRKATEVAAAAGEIDRTTQALAQGEAAVGAAIDTLLHGPDFEWLATVGLPLPAAEESLDRQLDTLSRLHRATESVLGLLVATLNDQQSLEQALAGLSNQLRASSTVGLSERSGLELAVPVRRHYEERFAQDLQVKEVRDALFDGSEDVLVDLASMTTTWVSRDRQTQTRPLEAFSSGERAFAYTLVKVDRLASIRSANHAVFLDEFGSFVAHDRFQILMDYLKEHALGQIADQIVLILPLREKANEQELVEMKRRGGYLIR